MKRPHRSHVRDSRAKPDSSTQPWRARIAAACVGVALLAACGARQRERERPSAVEATSARVDVFLRCVDPAARAISFDIAGAAVRDELGQVRTLELARQHVSSRELASRSRIAGAIVPPTGYAALELTLGAAWLERADGRVPLELERDERGLTVLEIPASFRVDARQASSLFVDWRAGPSLVGGASFAPQFSVSLETPQTALGLLYVADAATSSVLAIDRASGQVVGTYKTGSEPRALALARDRRRLWAANAGDGSVLAIDTRQGTIETTLPIAFGAGTCDLVFADPERWLAAANRELDSVSLIALGSGSSVQVSVGRDPLRLASAPGLGRVYSANFGDDTISVIDVNARGVVATIATESRPSALDVDRDEHQLFVGHATSPNLLVYDAQSLAQQRAVFVGADVTDVLADRRTARVYVARARPNEMVVVDTRIGAVVRRFPLSGRIESMAQSREGSRVYGASAERGAVLVIDVVLSKEEPAIHCGSRPSDVVLAE
ncbi:MAG: YncE family protein [Planctomycetes bacterium]|nr:YncE family protein [Planctomycetota bacterium]